MIQGFSLTEICLGLFRRWIRFKFLLITFLKVCKYFHQYNAKKIIIWRLICEKSIFCIRPMNRSDVVVKSTKTDAFHKLAHDVVQSKNG